MPSDTASSAPADVWADDESDGGARAEDGGLKARSYKEDLREALRRTSAVVGDARLKEVGLPPDLSMLLDDMMVRHWQRAGVTPQSIIDELPCLVLGVNGLCIERPGAWLYSKIKSACAGRERAERKPEIKHERRPEGRRERREGRVDGGKGAASGCGSAADNARPSELFAAPPAAGPFECGWEMARALAASGDFESLSSVVAHAEGFLAGASPEEPLNAPARQQNFSYSSSFAFARSLRSKGPVAMRALHMETVRWSGVLAHASAVSAAAGRRMCVE